MASVFILYFTVVKLKYFLSHFDSCLYCVDVCWCYRCQNLKQANSNKILNNDLSVTSESDNGIENKI